MYKGKRRRLRKRDLHKTTTLTWNVDQKLTKFVVENAGKDRSIVDENPVDGVACDKLEFSVYLTIFNEHGDKVVDHGKFVLLPSGPTYYSVEEYLP